jgi:hypothetical protein
MKILSPIRLLCVLIVLAAVSAILLLREWKSDAKDHHVILISLDGFPALMWQNESLQVPNLRKLAAEGAVAKAMTVSNPSVTWINHTTLVTGVEPRKHGVLFNGLLVRQGTTNPPRSSPGWTNRSWSMCPRSMTSPTRPA